LVPALTDASGDSLPERNHSPGSLPFAGSGRDTGVLAALPSAPTPFNTHGLSPTLLSRTYAANPPARIDRCLRWLARLRLPRWIRSNAAGLPVHNPDAPLFVARPLRGHPRFSPLPPQNRHPGPTPKLRPFSRYRAPSRDYLPAKPHPDGCLILAPAPAGGRAARAPSPSTPQGIARFAALHLARRR